MAFPSPGGDMLKQLTDGKGFEAKQGTFPSPGGDMLKLPAPAAGAQTKYRFRPLAGIC